jgi:peptidoglycan hydrolase-like protein with peptidoglycan-binding domain
VADTTSTTQVVKDTTTTTVAEVTITDTACTISEFEISVGDMGESVRCAQIALVAAGYSNVEITGVFDERTDEATREFQTDVELYVDGIIGKVTATELGVWPGLEAFIVRTPAPAPGAVDLVGMPLSPVASSGSDAPELPEDAGQGTGKRVVYQRSSQRVWAIDEGEGVVRSYLVSGSRYRNEVPGWHKVYSRSESALGWDLQADLPYMIRYTRTERGHIGFHAIPSWRDSGEKLQTIEELGERLSGGCTRQAPQDAEFLWSFADVGTRVLVL